MKYNELIQEWLIEQEMYRIKKRTYLGYLEIIRSHISSTLGERSLSLLTLADVRNFQTELFHIGNCKTGKPLSSNTVKKIMSIVKNSLKYARSKGLINFVPTDLITPKITEKPITAFSQNEQSRIVQTV